MKKCEVLIAEYEEEIEIEEHHMKNDGLYCDGVIWINKNMAEDKKACILAEEIGHHFTSVGDILNQDEITHIKQECKARNWAFDKLLPFEVFIETVKLGYYTIPDVAEYLGLSELFIKDCIEHYKEKLGMEFPIEE
ncbi:MAG: ImmA/IrrE family metallo-endopeptidase [Aminipila sp.]